MKKICLLILLCIISLVPVGCQKTNEADGGKKDVVESVHGDVNDDTVSNNKNVAVIEIVSDITTLYYPEKWSEKITIEKIENTISFSSEGTRLFDFIFGGYEGTLLGYYNGIEVRIISYEIIEANYTEDQYWMLRAMQEDIDVVIEYLIDDKNFVLN